MVDKLTSVSDDLTDLQFKVATGGISKSAGQKELNALVKQFDLLNKQADALTSSSAVGGGGGLAGLKTDSASTVINLTVTGAFDKEGTARTIVETLNDSFYRGGGGGANALVMP